MPSRLRRLPRDDFDQPRYLHPNGYVITRDKRTWSERGRERGRHHDPPPPMFWWRVEMHMARRRSMLASRPPAFLCSVSDHFGSPGDFETLRMARAYCDEHPRDGWTPEELITKPGGLTQ